MTKFKKGDLVRVHAKEFDGERDEEGRLFSEKWAADGHGEWCYGTISHVYVRKGREAQKYRIKYDEGSSMSCLEGIIEFAPEGEESDCSTVHSEREGSVASEEDVLGDPQGEDGDSEDEDPGTVEEVDSITMLRWISTAPCCLPHMSIVKRIPQRKGCEIKIITLNSPLP